MSDFWSKVLQLIASFSILVTVHELGHFLTARWFKCRVEKFYLFFNPWFSLFKKKVGETEYGIGWIPFGGYVKIAGMVDESMDKEQLTKPVQSWEFRSKKPWQKIIVMTAGVVFNFLLAFLIYIGVSYYYGEEYIANKDLKYGLRISKTGKKIGLKNGDIIVAVGNKQVDNYRDILKEVILQEAKDITVLRDGNSFHIAIPPGFIHSLTQKTMQKETHFAPQIPAIVREVLPDAHLEGDELQNGDRVLFINGMPTYFLEDVLYALNGIKNRTIPLRVLRGEKDTVTLQAQVNEKGKIGIVFGIDLLPVTRKRYGFFEAVLRGKELAVTTFVDYIRNLRLLFVSNEVKINESLGSVISIGKIFPSVFDWRSFWILTAFLSIIIGFMNLLPVPALDGGHIVFALYEWIMKKPANPKVLEYSQMVGMVLLFGLMFYALGLDITRFLK